MEMDIENYYNSAGSSGGESATGVGPVDPLPTEPAPQPTKGKGKAPAATAAKKPAAPRSAAKKPAAAAKKLEPIRVEPGMEDRSMIGDNERELEMQRMAQEMAPTNAYEASGSGRPTDEEMLDIADPPLKFEKQEATVFSDPDRMRMDERLWLWTYEAKMHNDGRKRHGIVVSAPDWDDAEQSVLRALKIVPGEAAVQLEAANTDFAFCWPLDDFTLSSSKTEYRNQRLPASQTLLWTVYLDELELLTARLASYQDRQAVLNCIDLDRGRGMVLCAIASSHQQAMELMLHHCEMMYCSRLDPGALEREGSAHPLHQLLEQRMERFEIVPTVIGW